MKSLPIVLAIIGAALMVTGYVIVGVIAFIASFITAVEEDRL